MYLSMIFCQYLLINDIILPFILPILDNFWFQSQVARTSVPPCTEVLIRKVGPPENEGTYLLVPSFLGGLLVHSFFLPYFENKAKNWGINIPPKMTCLNYSLPSQ